MQIKIKTINRNKQRYPTIGDWVWGKKGDLFIYVSEMFNFKKRLYSYEILVAFHELVEAILCRDRGITQSSVDKFDIQFEKKRTNQDEPGHDSRAPYKKEHITAEKFERLLAKELNIDWDEYEGYISSL